MVEFTVDMEVHGVQKRKLCITQEMIKKALAELNEDAGTKVEEISEQALAAVLNVQETYLDDIQYDCMNTWADMLGSYFADLMYDNDKVIIEKSNIEGDCFTFDDRGAEVVE